MNYVPLIKVKLSELSKEAPDMSFGELIYTAFLKLKTRGENMKWIREASDKEVYTAFEKAIESEKEFNKETDE